MIEWASLWERGCVRRGRPQRAREELLMEEVVKAVVKEIGSTFQASGAELEVRQITQDLVKIAVVFGPEPCRACIVSAEVIEAILTNVLEARLGHPINVIVKEVG
jgi:Fe-S cluster biogenesis protein NfuA